MSLQHFTKLMLLAPNTEVTMKFTKTSKIFKLTAKERKCAEDLLKVYVTLKKKREAG